MISFIRSIEHATGTSGRATPLLCLGIAVALSACQSSAVGPVAAPTATSEAGGARAQFMSGAYLGDELSTPERIRGAIGDFSRTVGKQPALVKTFHTLDCDFSPGGWCGRVLREIAAAKSTNYVALDLMWNGSPKTGVLEAVIAGKADEAFARTARQLAGIGSVVLLEPAWEMNGNWSYSWQGVANGGDASAPARYAAAWRRMVEIFRREGATNVRWVFNPNAGNPLTYAPTGASHWNWYANYYPGDKYVDYVGAHGFNGPTVWGGEYQDFATMFDGAKADHMLSDLVRRFPDKPIIIGEFATEEVAGRDKGQWIGDAFRRLRTHPNVVGAVWFHMKKESDWRVDSSPSALAAYRSAMGEAGVVVAYNEGVLQQRTRLSSAR